MINIDINYNKNNINFQENIYIIFQVIERTFELLTFFKVRKIRVKFELQKERRNNWIKKIKEIILCNDKQN